MWRNGKQHLVNKNEQRRVTFAARFYAAINGRDVDAWKSGQR